jgi:Photoprotection regulator fluorescence recovery protein
MHDMKWSGAEKRIARTVFDAALQRELAQIVSEFKTRAAAITEPQALWSLLDRTDRLRADIDRKYDFRYSQLPVVFGRLLREGRIAPDDLQGLGDDKIAVMRKIAEL